MEGDKRGKQGSLLEYRNKNIRTSINLINLIPPVIKYVL